ncbi:hypothetical protein KGQ20_26270 [Catenulispora sp. NF23]|uniref:Uncharacterized protein n=1 Tax=Catenulispora pinistramenti TaxID=2705254 RepID=A0ABS5KWU9_9ACTN|nr:hypothetical protein [Catenulispora pinistramenti]MBS2536275.1 hypothetical protein [Catenulispora pinistramenti]MBS2550542.1 hypothetical protein [Catenulispora pinistramenti]
MTGFGDRDEEYGLSATGGVSGEEHAAQTRAWLAQSVGETRPRLGFTAEDLVLGGRRKVRRRRVAAALASTASVAAVAVAVTAFAGGGGSQVVAGTGATPTAVSGSSSSPTTAQGSKSRSDQAAYAVLAKLFGELDPGGKHLTSTQPPLSVTNMGGSCDTESQLEDGYSFTEQWTVDGRPAIPRKNNDSTPVVQVTVLVTAASQQQDMFGVWGGVQESWGPIAKTTLPDGSVLQTGTAANGHYVQAVRTLTDGRRIIAYAIDGSVRGVGADKTVRPTDPFPYTADQLGQIVAGSSLPLPFANGYQPPMDCGPNPPS